MPQESSTTKVGRTDENISFWAPKKNISPQIIFFGPIHATDFYLHLHLSRFRLSLAMSTRIGPYVTKPKRTRDAKRADSAPPEEGAPSAWQKSKRTAVAKVKAKLGADEYVRICEQYTSGSLQEPVEHIHDRSCYLCCFCACLPAQDQNTPR